MLYCCTQKGESIDKIELPKSPTIKIKYKEHKSLISHEKINVQYNFLDGKKQKKSMERDEILLNHAARTIKKYSQCKEKLPEIKKFLDEILRPKIHDDDTFIGNFPLSFYSAVSAGIFKFSGQIQDIQYDDDES